MNNFKNIIIEQSKYYFDPTWNPSEEDETIIIPGLSRFDPLEYAWNSTTETYWTKKTKEDDDKWRNLILYSNYDKLKLKLDKAVEKLKTDNITDTEIETGDGGNGEPEIVTVNQPEVKRETKTVVYDDGSVYVGEVIIIDGKDIRDGKGVNTAKDGTKLDGKFKDNNLIEGTYYFTNGDYIFAEDWGAEEKDGTLFIKDGTMCKYYVEADRNTYEGRWDRKNQRVITGSGPDDYYQVNPSVDNTAIANDKKKAVEDAKLKADAEAKKKADDAAKQNTKKKEVVKTDPTQKAIASNYLLQKQFVANLAVQLNNDKKLREKYKKGSEIMTSVQNYYNDKFPLIKTGNSSILKQNNKNIITWINLMRPKLNGGTNFTVDMNLTNPTTNKTEKTTVTINVF